MRHLSVDHSRRPACFAGTGRGIDANHAGACWAIHCACRAGQPSDIAHVYRALFRRATPDDVASQGSDLLWSVRTLRYDDIDPETICEEAKAALQTVQRVDGVDDVQDDFGDLLARHGDLADDLTDLLSEDGNSSDESDADMDEDACDPWAAL